MFGTPGFLGFWSSCDPELAGLLLDMTTWCSCVWQSITGQLEGPHPLFTFPLCIHGSLLLTWNKVARIVSLSLVQQTRAQLSLPSNDADKWHIHCLCSPSPSLLLSYQHPLVRSSTQHTATPLWNLRLAAYKRPFTGKAFFPFGECCCNQQSLDSPAIYSKLSSRAEAGRSPFLVAGWRSRSVPILYVVLQPAGGVFLNLSHII